MSEKRRLSTRNRGEPPLKKRALSPPPPPAAPLKPLLPSEPREGALPVRLREDQPLPTLPQKQDQDLSTKSYQSISESGVLAASIERSRDKWLTRGILDLYWWKSIKKRDMGNKPKPAKETMTKLGVCSMIVDPHLFEATLYTVKELPSDYTLPSLQPPSLSAPQYNPFTQSQAYAPPSFNPTSPAPPPSYQAQQYTHPLQQTLPPFREGFGSFGPQGPSPVYHPPVRTHPSANSPPGATFPGPPKLAGTGIMSQEASQGENADAKADPVIQMLANRAANDDKLKNLMKVVASGKASQKQLREFQDHIDELNSILKSRSTPPPSFGHDGSADRLPPPSASGYADAPNRPAKPDMSWNSTLPEASTSFAHPVIPPIKVEPISKLYPVPAVPPIIKGPSSGKTDINGIVFDFGTGDRYSLPRFSILEYLYGGTQVLVSFIVIRRGDAASSGDYKGTLSYYQPITLRLTTPHPRILEPLARAVAPPEEVRSYMNNYFDRLNPAESVHLATRLPRTMDAGDCEKQETLSQSDVPLIKPLYPPPDSIMPLAA